MKSWVEEVDKVQKVLAMEIGRKIEEATKKIPRGV